MFHVEYTQTKGPSQKTIKVFGISSNTPNSDTVRKKCHNEAIKGVINIHTYSKDMHTFQSSFHQIIKMLIFIKFSSAQTLIFSTSSEALSLTLGPTGILHVMSSVYLVIKVFWGVGLISFSMMVKSTGPRTVPQDTPRLTGKNEAMTLSTRALCL